MGNGQETIGAVFSVSAASKEQKEVSGKAKIVKVTQYVEKLAEGRGYFVVFETEQGTKIVTEKLPDTKVVFEENPADLCDRISSAKVVRSADCSASLVDVEGMKTYQALEARFGANFSKRHATPSKCKRYSQSVFSR